MTCLALLLFMPITKSQDKPIPAPMKILKWTFIVLLTAAFAFLWLKSFYHFAQHPTREPKYIDHETETAPAATPSDPTS